MLARARAAKAQKAGGQAPPPTSAALPPKPAATLPPKPAATLPPKPKAAPAKGLPFTDEMYDNLKIAINTITGRMKSEKPLTSAEIQKFSVAVSAIVEDAGFEAPKKSAPPAFAPPKKKAQARSADSDDSTIIWGPGEGPRSTETPDANSPFSPLHGLKSMWQVPGMESMDTETYYRKINERNTEMKQIRKQRGEPFGAQASEAYFASLNRKQNQPSEEEQQ